MNPGVLAYFHWRNKWPPLFASMAEMSFVDGLVLEHMLMTHGEFERRVAMGDTNAARSNANACLDKLKTILSQPPGAPENVRKDAAASSN